MTLQYAKDLKRVNLITKMDVYVVVSISGGDKKKQRTKTPVDHDGDANPTWDFPMKFPVDEAALQQNRLMIDFKLVCQRALGDRVIGEVHVPVKELLDFPAPKGCAAVGKRFISYQVTKPSGKPKGQLNFSYQFTGKPTSAAAPAAAMAHEEFESAYPVVSPISAYPPTPTGGYPPDLSYPMTAAASGATPGEYPPPPGYGYPPPLSSYYYQPPPLLPPGYIYPPQPFYVYPPPQPCYGNPPRSGICFPVGVGLTFDGT